MIHLFPRDAKGNTIHMYTGSLTCLLLLAGFSVGHLAGGGGDVRVWEGGGGDVRVWEGGGVRVWEGEGGGGGVRVWEGWGGGVKVESWRWVALSLEYECGRIYEGN